MNIVDFSEGILGLDHPLSDGRQARDVVAKCLWQYASTENPGIALVMSHVAKVIESGERPKIELIREIGEERLRHTKELFYAP